MMLEAELCFMVLLTGPAGKYLACLKDFDEFKCFLGIWVLLTQLIISLLMSQMIFHLTFLSYNQLTIFSVYL